MRKTTCFNRALALHLSAQLDGVPGLTVCNFHELVKLLIRAGVQRAGPAPQTQLSGDFTEMAGQLRQVLRTLLKRDGLRPEQVVVLAPYRHTNTTSGWAAGLDEVTLNLDVVNAVPGQVRIGTIQGFKGLEADVVIVAGLDRKAGQHPEWLYVGASRARAALYLLALDSAGLD